MSATITTPPAGQTSATPPVAGIGGPNKKEGSNTQGPEDIMGVGAGTTTTQNRPVLPAPTMSAAAMMIALTALNSKIAEEGMSFAESSMEGVRKDIKESAVKRAEQLEKHFENLDKVSSKQKCGLFGAIANFFKKLFTGDIKGAFQVIGDNIANIIKDIAQLVAVAVAIVAAVALTVGTAGAGAGTIALAVAGAALVVGGMALTDPGVTQMIMESLPESSQQAVAIALAVVGAIMAVAGGIMMGVATGGASTFATVSTVTTALSGIGNAGVTLANGVDGFLQSGFKADAAKSQANIDRTDAQITDLKGILSRNQTDLKALFESFSTILRSTQDMIATYGQTQSRAASV